MPAAVELTARAPHPTGTSPATEISYVSGPALQPSSRVVIFIHGYNNTTAKSRESYARFLELTGLEASGLGGQVYLLHWPGNKNLGKVSVVSYPAELKPATDSGKLLLQFLKNLATETPGGWPLEVTLICHSLGNRLALEMLREHAAQPAPDSPVLFARGCLMAAAVPVFRVETGGSLRPAAESIQRSLNLYSPSDEVLALGFPVGQTLAGDGFLPRAVGRFGQPANGLWTERENMGIHAYDHGDYWWKQQSADAVVRFLGGTPPRDLPVATLPSSPLPPEADIAPRKLPAPPSTATNQLTSRR